MTTKEANNQKLIRIWRGTRPFIIAAVLVAVLSYTKALSALSYATGSLLMMTGVMNATPGAKVAGHDFDYDFIIKDLKGNQVDFRRFKGKVIFLNLWATWCGPCRMEMPSIQALYEATDSTKVAFIMLSLDNEESHQKVVSYITDKKFTFPVYETLGYLPKQLRVNSIPTTFIVGKDGKVKSKKVGAANYATDEFRQFLEELK